MLFVYIIDYYYRNDFLINLFFKDFTYLFLERGEGKKRGEKHQCMVASRVPQTGDLARNPGTCPEWELNPEPFGSQAHTQSAELHQPGHRNDFTTGSLVICYLLFDFSGLCKFFELVI